ncbi:hypothetical protein AAL_03463 [Moelleriella libera RCEF 2490]|uniref:Uncharacterized protein n=1 Tax=Moelleriella libera RCEF 2490 TaxID=1081109 RepID=A0A168D948_9HYPO|nr:hypothetical protein AAL_03463 [Moelleriella libera RCEF 2490]
MLKRQLQPQLPLTPLVLTLLSSFACSDPILRGVVIPRREPDNSKSPFVGADSTTTSNSGADSSLSAGVQRETKYLPAQVGGIVGAYGLSLVLVAVALLLLSKKRRKHLQAEKDELLCGETADLYGAEGQSPIRGPQKSSSTPTGPSVRNFSYPSPVKAHFDNRQLPPPPPRRAPKITLSPISTAGAPGVHPAVDQKVVSADREMAQSQLEEMYRHVLEHEDAMQRGVVLDIPVITPPSKKDRAKPAGLHINSTHDGKTQSRTSSFFSSLRSPFKKEIKGTNISSPLMTPQSATFPRFESRELGMASPRRYTPAPPPPIPVGQISSTAQARGSGAPPTPDMSPQSTQSIDERITSLIGAPRNRKMSATLSEVDIPSATSEHSQATLVGLPSPTMRSAPFPSLPSSPKPGATFSRSPPSAVRTGGKLPLRAYEPALNSPSLGSHNTKQTVFERKGPLAAGGAMTPMTAGAVPYSPYQPFTPLVPVTPSLVTREDRKRMKRLVPKTPTTEMVQSSDDIW